MRALIFALTLSLAACGGESTKLVTVRSGTGQGPIDFAVKNATDVGINSVFMAQSEIVQKNNAQERDPGSASGRAFWGSDLLGKAIPVGERAPVPVKEPGRWDLLAADSDGREQHIEGLKLDAGGRYILELYEGGWRFPGP